MGGMGPGQRPWGHANDVPHFDKEGHMRTHEGIEAERRRQQRRSNGYGHEIPRDSKSSFLAQFLLMTGVVGLTAWIPTVIMEKTGKTARRADK